MSMPVLDRDEYVEQAYFFRALRERLQQNRSAQELFESLRQEILATTKLPLAIEFLAAELKLHGVFAPAMQRLSHYFTPFQSFTVGEAEREGGRFDFQVALEVLEREARYRGGGASLEGLFLFQFEVLCRHRLGYDRGLEAVAADPAFSPEWKEWILTIRRQIGMVELTDLIYVRSEHYVQVRARQGQPPEQPDKRPLFGEREGKIALAHRHKDPLLFFAALERHLGYPVVPRPPQPDETRDVLPALARRLERVEARLRLVEEEQRSGAVDLSKFYGRPAGEAPNPDGT